MKVTVFSTLAFERPFLEKANAGRHELRFLEAPLKRHYRGPVSGLGGRLRVGLQ